MGRDGMPADLNDIDVSELRALGRKAIIDLARRRALEAGSRMVPEDDSEVKVLVKEGAIKVVLAEGLRAYDCDGARRIENISIEVHFDDAGAGVMYEGEDRMTDRDRDVLAHVMEKKPSEYRHIGLTVIDDPGEDPDNYIVELESPNTMGRYTVDRKTGEWKYILHKHFAPRPVEEWVEMGD